MSGPRGPLQTLFSARNSYATDSRHRSSINRTLKRRREHWRSMPVPDNLAREFGDDPGDRALLERGAAEDRILVLLDGNFAELVYVREAAHAGLVRLPDVPAKQRIALMAKVIERHRQALDTRAVVTVRDDRIRVSRPPET